MNDKYNSEKNLKDAFVGYEMSFDNEAFEKFKRGLDKEEKRKKLIWWMFFGKITIPLFALGIIVFSLISYNQSSPKELLPSATTISISSTPAIGTNTIANVTQVNQKIDLESKNSIKIKSEHLTSIVIKDKDLEPNTSLNSVGSLSSFNEKITSPSTDILSINSRSFRGLSNSLEQSMDVHKNEQSHDETELAPSQIKSNNKEENNPLLQNVQLLNSLGLVEIEGLVKEKLFLPIPKISLYTKKYKKHFFFNFGTGITKEDNYGPRDEFFELNETNELFWHVSIAYQINNSTSFQLSYLRKNITLGFKLKDYIYTEKLGNKISLFKASMINKIWSPSQYINLNITNGLSIVKAPDYFNEFAEFSNTFAGPDLPTAISNFETKRTGLYSNNHFMYSSGINLDYKLTENVEINIGAEYTLGLKPIMSAELNYIEGEGIIKKVASVTNSSFAALSFGLKYRLRGLSNVVKKPVNGVIKQFQK